MKKILMAAVALICMTMSGIVLSSCGDDDDNPVQEIAYFRIDSSDAKWVDGYDATYQAFVSELSAVLNVVQYGGIDDNKVIRDVQTVVDQYNNDVISGTFELKKSSDNVNFKTLHTYKMQFNSRYQH